MSYSTDTPGHLPPAPGADHAKPMKIGRELFEGRTAGGDPVTFVCYDDGYGIRSNGQPVPGCRWDAEQAADALAAFRDLANPVMERLAAPPAA